MARRILKPTPNDSAQRAAKGETIPTRFRSCIIFSCVTVLRKFWKDILKGKSNGEYDRKCWEWTADRFTNLHSPHPVRNPSGPLNGGRYVAKGGSYLCHASYCTRYRTSSRQSLPPDTTTGNLGFRLARSLKFQKA